VPPYYIKPISPHSIHIYALPFIHPSTYLRNQHLVTGLHRRRYSLAVLVEQTGTYGQHLRLVEVLDGGFGQEDAAGGFGIGLDALDEDAVEEGDEVLDGLDGE
jgi:hypothetical protein